MDIKRLFKIDIKIRYLICVIIAGVLLGACFLILCNCLPNDKVRERIERYASTTCEDTVMMQANRLDKMLMQGVDNVVLNYIYNQNNNEPIKDALILKQYIPNDSEGSQIEALKRVTSGETKENEGKYYSFGQYWLGQMAVEKVLLHFVSVERVTDIIRFVSLAILLTTVIMMTVFSRKSEMVIPFLFSLICISIETLLMNIYMGITMISTLCIGVCIYLLFYQKKKKISFAMLFVCIGLAAAFFDYFTIPLITWGVLIIFILLNENQRNFTDNFNITFNSAVGWICGYLFMIISKYIIILPFVGSNERKAMLFSISRETVFNGESWIKQVGKLFANLQPLVGESSPKMKYIYILALVLIVVLSILCIFKKRGLYSFIYIISISPLLWFGVFKGHIHHSHLDYRTLMISVFGVLSVIFDYLTEKRNVAKE